MTADFYSILGVEPTATVGEIKERFRFLSHAYHPDKFAAATQREAAEREFKRINEAYHFLSDPTQRANYDRQRARQTRTESTTRPTSPTPPSPPPPSPDASASHLKTTTNESTGGVLLLWIAAAGMLLFAAIGKHPYSFYMLLRWVCCPILAYSAYVAHEKHRLAWTWVFGLLALLYNPIFRVHLDRDTWAAMNWFTLGGILVAAVVFWQDKISASRAAEKSTGASTTRSRQSTRPFPWMLAVTAGVIVLFTLLLRWNSRDRSSSPPENARITAPPSTPAITKATPPQSSGNPETFVPLGAQRGSPRYQPLTEVCSDNHNYCITIAPIAGHPDKCILRISSGDGTLAEFPTMGYLVGVFFSPDNRYVAVNNRRANAGDYLWVVSLADGQPLKIPEDLADALGKKELGRMSGDHPFAEPTRELIGLCRSCTGENLRHPFLFARGWKNSTELKVVEELEFPEGWIALNKICRITARRLSLVQQKIEKQAGPSEVVKQAWTWSPFHVN